MKQLSVRWYYGYVCVTGAAVMMLEFAASRVIAPWFGSSIFVWGNIVGAILIALSLGYYWGGKLADSRPELRVLTGIVLVAGLFSSFIPVLLALAVQHISLSSVFAGNAILTTILGSFIIIVLLFAFPVGLLGMVSPYVIRLNIVTLDRAGQVAGGLYAWSTLGSIVGTFASAFFFVPYLGSRETIFIAAASLIFVAVFTQVYTYRTKWWLLSLLLVPVMLYLIFAKQPLLANAAEITEQESQYQFITLQDKGDRLALIYNEGLGTQSYYMKTGVLTGAYYDYLALLPYLKQSNSPDHIAVLGLAGGTLTREYHQYFPADQLTGVEVDPRVIQLARQYFHLDDQQVTVVENDARNFIRTTSNQYDIIVLDAFTNEYYIPWYLTTQENFRLLHDHLNPHGVVAFNIGSATPDTALLRSLIATLYTVFKHVYITSVPDSLNYIVTASDNELSVAGLAQVSDERTESAQYMMSHWQTAVQPDAAILTDNRAPIEIYTESMIWQFLWQKIQ